RHTRFSRDWSSDVCSSDLDLPVHAFEHDSLSRLHAGKIPGKEVELRPERAVIRDDEQGFAARVLAGIGMALGDDARDGRVHRVGLKAFVALDGGEAIARFHSVTD